MRVYFSGKKSATNGKRTNRIRAVARFGRGPWPLGDLRVLCGYNDDDPLFFQSGLRLTCRCGEEVAGKKLHDPPETQYTTYSWVYQW